MISLFNMLPDEKKRQNTFGLMDMWEGVKDVILPIIGDTPYGWAAEKVKEHGASFTRELGHGLYTDLPQGVLDLGTDIINRGGNILGREGDFINRESVQVVPPVFDEGERRQLGMKSLEEDSVGRILGQLLGGYAGIRGVLSKGLMSEAVAVSGAGSTLDPERPNLSNFIQDTRFNNALFEYMAAGVPEEAGAEERLLARVGNMTEELGLAFIPLGLIQGIRAMKNNPAIKEEILDTFHPDRMGGLLSDKTGLTTDYRMLAVPEEGGLLPTPKVDSAGFYLKSEQQVMAMKQDKMQASHVEGYLIGRGVSPSEMKDLGLLEMLGKLPENSMITKQGLLDYIDKNRITMTSDSLVLGGLDKQLKTLDAPNPVDYYVREKSFRGLNVDQLRRITEGEALPYETQGVEWETEKWYGADGTENKWKIQDNENLGMRTDELFEEIQNEGFRIDMEDFATTGNYEHVRLAETLHKLYPDKYPETASIRMDRLREAIRSREKYIQANPAADQGAKAEILKAGKELDELDAKFNDTDSGKFWGDEWDYKLMHNIAEDSLTPQQYSEVYEAIEDMATKEYMDDPYFEIKVGNDELGHYKYRGNDGIGWQVVDENNNAVLKSRGHLYLNEAQVQLREYVQDEGLLDDLYGIGEAKFTSTNWIQPNANMDTYSEELVRLESRPAVGMYDTYEAGHYGDDYPDTIGHFRKTIRSGTVVHPDITVPNEIKGQFADIDYSKVGGTQYSGRELKKGVESGLFTDDDNVYFVEEIQSDWMQSGRQFGFGEEANEQGVKDAEFRIKELQALIKKWKDYRGELNRVQTTQGRWVTDATGKRTRLEGEEGLKLFQLPTEGAQSKKGYQERLINLVDNKILQKAFQQGEVQGRRMKFYQNTESIDVGFDPNEYSRTIQPHEVRSQKEWNERWKVDPRNPQAENFKGFGDADIESLDEWMWQEIQRLNKHIDEAPSNIVPEFTPVKDQDRDVKLMVKHAITKAIENGSTKVAFPNGDMILDVWNKARGETFHKKVEHEELYKNLYDKKIPKFLKKYAGKNKGKVGKIFIEDVDREVFYIEITPEMKKSLIDEVKPPYQTTKNIEEKGILHPQSLYAKFPLPIGAGLLGMQEDNKQQGLLL